MVTDNLVEHETLKTKLCKEFDRLNIKDEKTRDALTIELNRLAAILIATCSQNQKETKLHPA